MTTTYRLSSHLLHDELPFCIQPAIHDRAFELHKHDFSELMIVLAGSAEHVVGGTRSTIKPGDVFVIDGEVEHGFERPKGLTLYNLMFDGKNPCFETPQLRVLPGYQALFNVDPMIREQQSDVPYLNIQGEQLIRVISLLKEIETEYNSAKLGFESVLMGMLQHLAVLLVRNYPEQGLAAQTNTVAVARALSYIEQHFSEPMLRAQQIADNSYLSQRQLERLFHQFFGCTPSQYLIDKRISKATQLLSGDERLNINQIALSCGFNDSNYFARVFKKQQGLTPRQYRQSVKPKTEPE